MWTASQCCRIIPAAQRALPFINIPDYVYRKSMAFLPFMLHDSFSVCTYLPLGEWTEVVFLSAVVRVRAGGQVGIITQGAAAKDAKDKNMKKKGRNRHFYTIAQVSFLEGGARWSIAWSSLRVMERKSVYRIDDQYRLNPSLSGSRTGCSLSVTN